MPAQHAANDSVPPPCRYRSLVCGAGWPQVVDRACMHTRKATHTSASSSTRFRRRRAGRLYHPIPAPPMNHHRRLHSRGLFAAACLFDSSAISISGTQSRLESAWCSCKHSVAAWAGPANDDRPLSSDPATRSAQLHSDDDYSMQLSQAAGGHTASQSAKLQRCWSFVSAATRLLRRSHCPLAASPGRVARLPTPPVSLSPRLRFQSITCAGSQSSPTVETLARDSLDRSLRRCRHVSGLSSNSASLRSHHAVCGLTVAANERHGRGVVCCAVLAAGARYCSACQWVGRTIPRLIRVRRPWPRSCERRVKIDACEEKSHHFLAPAAASHRGLASDELKHTSST
ncbi:hypothetical protein M409DRAFT_52982 [Zasmidium cellare ATCC 36951]|uniref:Uncharacterized protein n=1 Tax=Zasmidium cellare ATCC 36951 TaxID=1080233 RepID=A0A6A6CS83_ZASCE|nr:uncharacterized protein M409DRAFT_52982 [Zasmidium cellare ATCC 36951]KAF2169010.1 hypothetical protein M409DRAFT_52982 [Zasmidium cellare ATCC 36951]